MSISRLCAWLSVVLAGLSGAASADPLQDRSARIADEMSRLATGVLNGTLPEDRVTQRMEELLELDFRLRTDQLLPDDLTLRWQDQGVAPLKAPGARLVAVGLPADFSGAVWGLLDDGRPVSILAEQRADAPHSADIYLPDHPDGPDATGTLTVQFEGAGSLHAELAPQLDIPDALPILMRLAMQDLVKALSEDGIDAEDLVAQFRADATTIPPELGYAAAARYIWSEAGQGHPVFGFLRTGKLQSAFWRDLGVADEPQALNRMFSSALQNSGALERMMRMDRARIDKIRFVPPLPRQANTPLRVKNSGGYAAPPADNVSIGALSALLVEGRARQYNRKVILQSLKDAQKVYSIAAFEPATMTSAALVGGVLTMIDKHTKIEDYNYPVSLSIEGSPVPGDALLADDPRKVFPDLTLVAKGEPYEIKVFADGLDAALGALDLATSFTALGKGAKALGEGAEIVTKAERARRRLQASLDSAEDRLVGLATAAAKDTLEKKEQDGDTQQKGSFDIITVPARTWRTRVEPETYRPYVTLGYRGEADWDVRQYHARACWQGTGDGITAIATTKPDAFAGLFARLDMGWAVQTPEITLTAVPSRIAPGDVAAVTASVSGAQYSRVDFAAPPLGALSNTGNLDTTYVAPDSLQSCTELVTVTATYPHDSARICAPAPKALASIVIAKGDALIRTPQTLTCRDGEVLGFTVSHPDDAPVSCELIGPGRLTMVGNEGLLDCPVKPRTSSSIQCHTGQRAGQCAPVIPIKRIYPDYMVTAVVTADRRIPINTDVEDFFDDCGIDNPTALMLELMDLGTGAADDAPVDAITNNCPKTPAGVPGAIVTVDTGAAPEPETPAEGGHVANWPLGEGRDVSVSDSNSYRYDPPDSGRGPGDRSVLVTSDISADITFDGPERFVVVTDGRSTATSIRDAEHTPEPSGGFAQWRVWRRIVVNRDTAVTATINTGGDGISTVQALPMRLENNVPVALLSGFDQNMTSVMMVGNSNPSGLTPSQSASNTVVLPGPRNKGDTITYLIGFNGGVLPRSDGNDTVTAASRTTVEIDIRPQ